MNNLDYGEVDSVQVVHLNMLALDFPLRPGLVSPVRRTDPQPFPASPPFPEIIPALPGGISRLKACTR